MRKVGMGIRKDGDCLAAENAELKKLSAELTAENTALKKRNAELEAEFEARARKPKAGKAGGQNGAAEEVAEQDPAGE